MKKLSIICYCFLLFYSCKTKRKFSYVENKDAYLNVKSCLLANYPSFFSSGKKEQSVTFYADNLESQNLCKDAMKLLSNQSIEFIALDKDSTVTFFSQVEHGLSSKQFFLMFVKDGNINKRLTSDMVIIKKWNAGCYELMRIISLAN